MKDFTLKCFGWEIIRLMAKRYEGNAPQQYEDLIITGDYILNFFRREVLRIETGINEDNNRQQYCSLFILGWPALGINDYPRIRSGHYRFVYPALSMDWEEHTEEYLIITEFGPKQHAQFHGLTDDEYRHADYKERDLRHPTTGRRWPFQTYYQPFHILHMPSKEFRTIGEGFGYEEYERCQRVLCRMLNLGVAVIEKPSKELYESIAFRDRGADVLDGPWPPPNWIRAPDRYPD